MGTREMPHPLCCISLDLAGLGARSPSPADPRPRAGEGEAGPADSVTFCGALYKWTNIRKGWRLRWFSLHDGVLSYSKIARRELPTVPSGSRVRLIGNSSSMFSSSYSRGGCGCRQPRMPVRLVQLKFSGCEVSVLNESSPKHRMDGEDVASESEQRDPKHVRTESRPCPRAKKKRRNGKNVEYIT